MSQFDTNDDFRQPSDSPRPRERRAATYANDAATNSPTFTGQIKRITRDRGFGFIKDQAGNEYFFHRSESNGEFDEMVDGDRVSFQSAHSAKGPRAHNVHRLI